MAASTVTPERSSSRWLTILLKVFLVVLGLAVTFTLYKYSWFLGTTSFLLTVLLGLLIFLPADFRRLGLFLFINLVIITVIAGWLQRQFARDELVRHFIARNEVLTFLLQGFGETVFWSIVLALLISLAITVIPLLIVAYVGAVYVLSLHQMEGLGIWDAMRHMISLLLGINLPSIVVQNGEAVVTKKEVRLALIGGPGHLIVKQGNVVVLERGGRITRIVNAGITNLRPLENIRNVFNLKVHSFTTDVEHVLTRDRIPLTISITIKFQVEPAAEADNRPESRLAPTGEALTPKLDDGLYQVYEGTIRKAALTSQAISLDTRQVEKCREEYCIDLEQTEWQKVAGSAPEAELRDYIMSHRFDELFGLTEGVDGEKPKVRVNSRKIQEIEEAILAQIKPNKLNIFGIVARSVDIGKINFPEGAERQLLEHWRAPWQQQVDLIEAETKVQRFLLEAHGSINVSDIKAKHELEIADLKAQAILINARAEAQRRVLEGRSEAEARAAFFQCVRDSLQLNGQPVDELTAAILQQLASTFASVNDMETFMRVHSRLNGQNLFFGGPSIAQSASITSNE